MTTASARAQTAPEPRETILDAAQHRLLAYGYHKTTMAEIAEDAGMSAANLYRYFRNKLDIVADCAARCMDERLERLRVIAGDDSVPPSDRLRRYAHEMLDDSHALAGPDSRIGELVDQVTRERPDLIHSRDAIHFDLLRSILDDGVERGEFDIDDSDAAARAIFSALTLFEVPLFVGLYPRDEFERRADLVINLVLTGLLPR